MAMAIPQTQLDAYRDIQEKLPERRKIVMQLILNCGNGLTLFEAESLLHWPVNRLSGRFTELRDAGMILDSGKRRINPNSGKAGIVWEARQFPHLHDINFRDEDGQLVFE